MEHVNGEKKVSIQGRGGGYFGEGQGCEIRRAKWPRPQNSSVFQPRDLSSSSDFQSRDLQS